LAFDLASQIQGVAIAWQVYSVRNSAFDLGLVGLALFTPSLLLAPVTGLVADRGRPAHDHLHGSRGLVLVMAVLAVAGTARAFRYPAVGALLPAIVPASATRTRRLARGVLD
jgi:hypothetical protein